MTVGLDELMIVNPATGGLRAVFLGRDGRLYGVEDAGHRRPVPGGEHGHPMRPARSTGPPRFFLGEDGTLYERVG